MRDRRNLLMIVVGLCAANGVLSPYLAIALQVTPVLMPEMFPRSVGWALFFSSVAVSTATLLLSGIPSALYERFTRDESGVTSMWIWAAGALFLSLPALLNLDRIVRAG